LSTLDERFRQDPTIVSRDIAGEMILVPIRQKAGDLESVYTLNTTASFVWERLDGERTLAEIKGELLERFEVDEDEAERDMVELVAQLESIGAIQAA